MGSWKTTLIGVLTIGVAVGAALLAFLKTGAMPDFTVLAPAVLAGWGLIHARDNDKSSEDVGIKPGG